MTLRQLRPRWFATQPGRSKQGMTFLCPHCRSVRLGVAFANPLDGKRPDPRTGSGKWINRHVHTTKLFDVPPGGPLWTVIAGRTFDDLTLAPSIDCSASGHWHGYITDGKVQ